MALHNRHQRQIWAFLSRIARAKAEIARLVRELAGARFGAVAFAGEPIAFPLTSDGAAIAQFFRQMDPNDMPIGGTAIARAMKLAQNGIQSAVWSVTPDQRGVLLRFTHDGR